MKTYPNMWLSSFLYWTSVKRIKKIRPLYYIDYYKEAAKALLSRELGWKWYGGHHLENADHSLYTVKEGVVVIKKGAVLPNGFVI